MKVNVFLKNQVVINAIFAFTLAIALLTPTLAYAHDLIIDQQTLIIIPIDNTHVPPNPGDPCSVCGE